MNPDNLHLHQFIGQVEEEIERDRVQSQFFLIQLQNISNDLRRYRENKQEREELDSIKLDPFALKLNRNSTKLPKASKATVNRRGNRFSLGKGKTYNFMKNRRTTKKRSSKITLETQLDDLLNGFEDNQEIYQNCLSDADNLIFDFFRKLMEKKEEREHLVDQYRLELSFIRKTAISRSEFIDILYNKIRRELRS